MRTAGGRARGTCRSLLLMLILLHLRPAIAEEPPQLSEHQIKAAFLVNFPKYVEWPPEALPATNSPIVIIVLGENKLGGELAKLAQGKTVDGHPLVVLDVAKQESITGDCHILFIGASERRRLPVILERLGKATILTVGESDDFLAGGGTINLTKQGKKIALEVNLASASRARLKISSKLLNVARVSKDKAP